MVGNPYKRIFRGETGVGGRIGEEEIRSAGAGSRDGKVEPQSFSYNSINEIESVEDM